MSVHHAARRPAPAPVIAGLAAAMLAAAALAPALAQSGAQSDAAGKNDGATNPLWRQGKVKNYLPDMSWPEVEALMKRTDMVIIPVAALEQHGPQGPIGTDFLNAVERAKLIAQRTDVLVAPILIPGNSPYHMEFPGTITLPAETVQEVYFEAAQSLMRTGFKRFLILNGHGGNAATSKFIVDRINQETPGIAVELGAAARPFYADRDEPDDALDSGPDDEQAKFDRHAGVGETSSSMYLIPTLVDLSKAHTATLTHPDHLEKMIPEVIAGDPTANLVFLAEALKAKSTGKKTSTREMTDTGSWSELNPAEATAARGRADSEAFTDAAVQFIEKWKKLRPMNAE